MQRDASWHVLPPQRGARIDGHAALPFRALVFGSVQRGERGPRSAASQVRRASASAPSRDPPPAGRAAAQTGWARQPGSSPAGPRAESGAGACALCRNSTSTPPAPASTIGPNCGSCVARGRPPPRARHILHHASLRRRRCRLRALTPQKAARSAWRRAGSAAPGRDRSWAPGAAHALAPPDSRGLRPATLAASCAIASASPSRYWRRVGLRLAFGQLQSGGTSRSGPARPAAPPLRHGSAAAAPPAAEHLKSSVMRS